LLLGATGNGGVGLVDNASGFANISSQTSGTTITGSVTYNYTAVPEPSDLTLLGAGAIGLLGYAWRRRAKA
jgi:hypothetical protein